MNFSQKSCFSPKRITRLHKIAQKSYFPHRFALNTYPDPTTASAFISPNRITRLHKTSNKSYVLHGFVLNTYPDPTIASSFIVPNRITRLHKVFEITQVSHRLALNTYPDLTIALSQSWASAMDRVQKRYFFSIPAAPGQRRHSKSLLFQINLNKNRYFSQSRLLPASAGTQNRYFFK